MRKCKHPKREHWTRREHVLRTDNRSDMLVRTYCGRCGAWLSLGPAKDTPETAIEVRAATLAEHFSRGIGIGGHRPDHCTGEHCWHWYEDDCSDDADSCCYCDHDGIVLPGIENECQVGYLARCITEHESEQRGERV